MNEIPFEYMHSDRNTSIHVNYKIAKSAINDSFNHFLDFHFKENIEIKYLGFDVMLEKMADANVAIEEQCVSIQLPLKIIIRKNSLLTNINAEGELNLSFLSNISVDDFCIINTQTHLTEYHWIREPQLSFGSFGFGIETLANTIINNIKSKFEERIDSFVKTQFDSKSLAETILGYIKNPIHTGLPLDLWLNMNPEKIGISKIENEKKFFSGKLGIHGTTYFTDLPIVDSDDSNAMPEFGWASEMDENSQIQFCLNFNLDKLNSILKNKFIGSSFKLENQTIVIDDITIDYKAERLIAHAYVSGYLKGQLIISGVPQFDYSSQKFTAQNVDISFKIENIVKRAGAWLFKSKILKKLESVLSFAVIEHIDFFQNLVDKKMLDYCVKDKLDLKVIIDNVRVIHFEMNEKGFILELDLLLKIETILSDFSAFYTQKIHVS